MPRLARVCLLLSFIAGTFLTASVALAATGALSEGLWTRQLAGTVGPYPVGMQLQIRDSARLEGGHYFYAKHLTNIPLDGRIDGDQVTLKGADGGVFKLHFVNATRTPGEPLTAYNSTGLAGVWTRGERTLPVELSFDWGRKGAPARLYDAVTDASDAEFEAMVRKFLGAVRRGDRAAAAALVSYPLNVNDGTGGKVRRRSIGGKAALLAQWDRIFTPATLKALEGAVPHEMFVRDGMAVLGFGVVYFDAKGAQTINISE